MKSFHGVLGIAVIILATVVSGCSSEQSYNTDQCIYIALAYVAASDEDLNDKEKEYLNDFVERSGLSQEQIEEVMSNVSDSGINLPLLDEDDQVERLENELDGIVKADGVYSDKEKEAIGLLANQLNLIKVNQAVLGYIIAASNFDGEQSDEESEYIQKFVKRNGLSEKRVNQVIENMEKGQLRDIDKDEEQQKMLLIEELAGVIKADGVVNDKEKVFFELSAEMFQIDKETASEKLK